MRIGHRGAVLAVAGALALFAHASTAGAQNRCLSGKTKCAAKKAAGLLDCYAKAQKTGGAVDPMCVQRVKDNFDGGADPFRGCFGKLEIRNDGPCITINDTSAMEAKVDAFVSDALAELVNGPHPTATPTPSPPTLTPTPASTPGVVNNQRCTGNTGVTCTSNADCSGVGGTCALWLGGPIPLSNGGVASCLTNQFDGTISGTFDVDTGASAGTWRILSRVYVGPAIDAPCPRCVGDAVANDGVRGGTCASGHNAGGSCDADGTSPQFASTSLDCQPASQSLVATQPVDLSNTTGGDGLTLSAASPQCRAAGASGFKCACDTCNDAAAEPCSSNADCPVPPGPLGAICGGKRCLSGPNEGASCTAASECPSSPCGVPGYATRPNQCDDDTCSPDVGNEGTCAAGPFDTYCGPIDTFRGCVSDADCPRAGDTCSVGRFRDCFTDNGEIGASITATGVADPPANHRADPILASVHCVGATNGVAVNVVAGLPGPERLELPVHATDDGNPGMCPTTLSFLAMPGSLPILDRGWTGLAHDQMVPTNALVTVAVTGCSGTPPSCGQCSYTGPLPNP